MNPHYLEVKRAYVLMTALTEEIIYNGYTNKHKYIKHYTNLDSHYISQFDLCNHQTRTSYNICSTTNPPI